MLEEVFELFGKQVYYDIELKWPHRRAGGLEEKVLTLIRARGLEGRCLISSFNPFCLRRVRRLHLRRPPRHPLPYCATVREPSTPAAPS